MAGVLLTNRNGEDLSDRPMATLRGSEMSPREITKAKRILNDLFLPRSLLTRSVLDQTKRDLDREFNYPDAVGIEVYRELYETDGIAARIVNVFPDECWAAYPEISDSPKERRSPFEVAWGKKCRDFRLWHYLHRGDRLSGVGRFGILLLGLDDGGDLSLPVPGVNEDGTRRPDAPDLDLIYVRVFHEASVWVNRIQTDFQNPRFGQPQIYAVQFMPLTVPGLVQAAPDNFQTGQQTFVHWSRIVHLADNRTTSETFGVPRLQQDYRRVYDLRKLLGSSAEMWWRGAFPGFTVTAMPEAAAEGSADLPSIRAEFERFMNGLQRYLFIQGAEVNALPVQLGDPTANVTQQLQAVAMSIGVPLRVLVGSEAGHLASTQDQGTWNKRVAQRQSNYLDPFVIRPFVERLVLLGVLPKPAGGTFEVCWDDLNSMTDEQRASVAMKRAQAFMQYASGGVETILPFVYFLVDEMGYTEERAQAVIEELGRAGRKVLTKELWKQQGQVPTSGSRGPSGGPRNGMGKPPRGKNRKKAVTKRNQ